MRGHGDFGRPRAGSRAHALHHDTTDEEIHEG